MKNNSLISKCYSIHQLQYVQRKLDMMIYPIGDWDMSIYESSRRAINLTLSCRIPCVLEHAKLTDEFKQSVREHLNKTLGKFLGWHEFIKTLPYYAADYVDVDKLGGINDIELIEYPTINSYTVRDVWDWTKFNISQLNWIHFLISLFREETSQPLTFDKVYSDRNCAYAKLISIANILGDAKLVKYSTDAQLRTFCIKSDSQSIGYAVMNLFSSFENGIGGYETKNRQIFEDDLYRLYTNFMTK